MKTRIDEAYEKGVYDGQRGTRLDDFSESDTADVITTMVAPHLVILSNLFDSDEEEEAYKKGYEYGMKHRYDKNGNRYHEPYPEDEGIKEKRKSSSQDDSTDTDSTRSGYSSSSAGGTDDLSSCAGPVLLILVGLFVANFVVFVVVPVLKVGLSVFIFIFILGKGTIKTAINHSSDFFFQSAERFSEKGFSINTVDVNTGEEKIIISSSTYYTFYELSPNGKKILFIQVFNHRPHLFTADIDGKNKVCLAKNTYSYCFLSDGRIVVLDHLNKATTRRLNVYNPDGKKLTYSSFPNSSSYLFSFYGKKILLFFWFGGGYRLADNSVPGGFYKDIYTLDRGISYEDESMLEASRSSLSPDSRKIAFLTRIPNCTNRYVINVVNVDGSNRKKIAEGNNYSWSPSSQRIIFDDFKGSKIGHIYSVNVNRDMPDYLFEGSYPSYSPDGKKIAFYNK